MGIDSGSSCTRVGHCEQEAQQQIEMLFQCRCRDGLAAEAGQQKVRAVYLALGQIDLCRMLLP